MTTTKKRPEVLVPAGTLEKLKVAVNYGADAVFVGGQAYGLRSRAGNFTMDELREGIEYAHARGVDVHVASNMVTHEGNEKGAGEWFRELRDMGLDAVIVSDPALIEICSTYAPGLNIHLSTQASATNVETFHFWKEYGLTRVVLAREVTMEELKLRPLSMALCVSHIQVAVPFLTTCQTVMPTVVVVHSLVVGNMTFTTCHSVKSEKVSTVKFLKNTLCQPWTCV